VIGSYWNRRTDDDLVGRSYRRGDVRDVFRPARQTTNPEGFLVCEALLPYGALWKTS
jgi:hypothetical protein